LETKLLNAQRQERLVEAEDFSQAMHILGETEYGRILEGAQTGKDIEEALDNYSSQIYEFLREVNLPENWLSFFLVRHDMHNLRVILKNHFLREDQHLLFPPGRLDVGLAKEAASSERLERLPPPYGRAAKRAKEKYEATKLGQIIDTVIDQEMHQELYRLALSEKRKFLKEFVARSIDIANLKIFLRSRILEKGAGFLAESLINYGHIPLKLFLSFASDSWEGIVSRLRATRYASLFGEGWREAMERGNLNHFDTVADNFLLDFAKQGKRVSMGPAPIFGYLLARESEIKTIRIILIGKLAGLSTAILKERMRTLYV
jgi:V/A-type H+-transporting ATPase subunit C